MTASASASAVATRTGRGSARRRRCTSGRSRGQTGDGPKLGRRRRLGIPKRLGDVFGDAEVVAAFSRLEGVERVG